MVQDTIFEKTEADNWFLRNKEVLINRKFNDDLISTLINKMVDKDKIKSVIELGSSNGYRLNLLKDILPNCERYVGVEASRAAVEDGKSRYGLEMYQSTLDAFNSDEKFDVVIVNFVYHWIDRENIFKAIANTDKLLNDGGYLILGDFLSDFPQRRNYHHLSGDEIFTYKIDYTNVFESLNTYKEIYRIMFNHDATTTVKEHFKDEKIGFAPSTERGFCSILRKDLYGYYYEYNHKN